MPSAENWGRVAIFDAIRAASADDDYGEDEMRAIRRLAESLKIAEDTVTDIEALCRDEAALKERRIDLVFGEQVPYQDRV